MSYETSYESGRKPFAPDLERGKWTHSRDFVFAGLALAFRMDIFSTVWYYSSHMGVFAIVPYLVCLGLFVVPLMVIQSFMGQFSSSGFISAFRLAPLFKGMGYVSLALNLTTLTYYSIFAVIPLFYLFSSLNPVLPWSCESFLTWYNQSAATDPSLYQHLCNSSEFNQTGDHNDSMAFYVTYNVPSVLYFTRLFGPDYLYATETEFIMPWQLLVCNFLVWSAVGFTLWKFFNTAAIGLLVRRCTAVTLILLSLCMVRLTFMPGAYNGLLEFLWPGIRETVEGIVVLPFFAVSAFGAGWGTIIALASFNKFQANVIKTNWYICLGQMLIYLAFVYTSCLITNHLQEFLPKEGEKEQYIHYNWILYLSSGSVWASTGLPQLWCLIYYLMLTVGSFTIIIIQAYALLVSVFDEFESLRPHKTRITLGLVILMALTSLYTCSSDGFSHYSALTADVLLSQIVMNLLLILVVLWIYGRERFQTDLEFMLGKPFATWRVYMMRFVAPLCLLFTMLMNLVIAYSEHVISSFLSLVTAIVFFISPWVFLPVYCVYIAWETAGNVGTRLKRICRPTDWYPVELEDRRRYEEAINNPEMTFQLQDVEGFNMADDSHLGDDTDDEEPTFQAY